MQPQVSYYTSNIENSFPNNQTQRHVDVV